MANSLPFNAVAVDGEYDRVYKAEDWAWYFATFIANGIFPKPSDGLQVVAYSGMEIRVNAGYAFINGYAFRNPATLSVTLDTAEGALNRVDRVVVRWDLPQRDMYIAVLKGTPSAKPTATAVTRTTEIWELALADIYVGKGVTRIQTQNITDQRFNSAVCGIVTGTVEEIDASVLTKQFTDFFNTYSAAVLDEFSAYKQSMEKYLTEIAGVYDSYVSKTEGLFAQYESQFNERYSSFESTLDNWDKELLSAYTDFMAKIKLFQSDAENEFNTWFESIKDKLGEDIAGSLQLQIEELAAAMQEVKKQAEAGTKETKEAIAALDERLKRVESGWGIDYKHDAVLGLCYMGAAYMSQHYERTGNCRYYGGGNRNASAHYFVGFNGEVWQCVEDANIAWHCGASSYKHAECRNANSIGIEMCVRKKNTKSMGATDKDWYFEDATVEAAAELTRYLMNKYGVPASHVIRHYDVTGKICPNPYVYNTSAHTWDEFKRKISGQAETPQGGNEKTIWNFLTGKGLNAYAVAGIMGNLYAESGLMPNNLQNTYNNKLGKTDAEYTAAVDNGSYGNFVKDSAGYGLAQWTYWSRKQALLNHAKQAGVSIADLNMQLGFLWEELQGYTAVMDALKKAGSVRAASDAVLTGYEKPADQSETVKKKRAEYGEGYYKKYAAGNGTKYYRVRKSWTDAASQLGAFTSLENAKSACKAGYTVYDDNGKAVYTAAGQQTSAGVPFSVQVDILDLNIRTGAGTNYAKTGETTGKGVFTIVEVKAGQGASAGWGRLKSGAGWISLDYATRLA